MKKLIRFRREFLGADGWHEIKDGVPLELLDNMTAQELQLAELELIDALVVDNDWPVIGLGHIQSKLALPHLYKLLNDVSATMKITIAHSIFQICHDIAMTEITLQSLADINDDADLISIFKFLPTFNDDRINKLHYSYTESNNYYLAYNAARTLHLSTDDIVAKFRNRNSKQ